MKNKMKVDAVDFAYTFGLEERFDPQIILISYLQESKEAPKKPKKGSQVSPAALVSYMCFMFLMVSRNEFLFGSNYYWDEFLFGFLP